MSALSQATVEPQERRAFEHLLERALAPLIPIAINYRMSANDLSTVVRGVYLHEIEARLEQDRGHPVSDARLALVTGLSRNEVMRVRTGTDGKTAASREVAAQLSRIAAVLSTWHSNPKFAGAYGLPLDLDLEPVAQNPQRSFAHLIETACVDMPRTVTLDELVANGVAEVVGGNLVRCRAKAAVSNNNPATGKVGALAQYGRLLGSAAGTVARTILSDDEGKGFFDRLLVSDMPLSANASQRFSKHAMTSADAFLTELDRWISSNSGEPPGDTGRRYGIGLFFFEERRDHDAGVAASGGKLHQNAV
jgi:hypothetical protein